MPSLMVGCATLADWTAPDKSASKSPDPRLDKLDKEFWDTLHHGRIQNVQSLIDRYKGIYALDPTQARAAVRLGFLHVWRLSEWTRLKTVGPEVIDDAHLCKAYFSEAKDMIHDDARIFGFYAACSMAAADINKNERALRQGYFAMLKAVDLWPEFNAFTAGYVMSNLPYGHERYHEAVDFQWQELDECFDEKVDRENFDMKPYLSQETKAGPKRACWNSWIAPHNFEGFFLNMGDVLVKNGQVKVARQIYQQAKYSKTYDKWPYKKVLEGRLKDTEKLVEIFRRPVTPPQKPDWPVIMFHSEFSCMACHQAG